jgi:hypothetical protein
MELANSNVVIAARHFNPSILTQMWLVRRGVVREEEFGAASIFTEHLCQVNTQRFNLLVVPDMLQFAADPSVAQEDALIAERVGGLVDALPHTPYTGIGLNFTWHEASKEATTALTRRLFFRPDVPPYTRFDVPDARFGSYLSKGFRTARLKLDIKPITVRRPEVPPEERLQFLFNFHKDLGGDGDTAVTDIHESLRLWGEAKRESESIVADAIGRR